MGQPKGLLLYEGETLLARALQLACSLELEPVLVGDASPYAGHALGVRRCADEVSGVGPLGGLLALLRHGSAITMACDMPLVQTSHLQALLDAFEREGEKENALIALSQRGGFFEPFPACCDPGLCALIESQLAQKKTSFQSLITSLASHQRVLIELAREATLDWDRPSDIFREASKR